MLDSTLTIISFGQDGGIFANLLRSNAFCLVQFIYQSYQVESQGRTFLALEPKDFGVIANCAVSDSKDDDHLTL